MISRSVSTRCVGTTARGVKCRGWASYDCPVCRAALCSWHVVWQNGPKCPWCGHTQKRNAGGRVEKQAAMEGELIVVEGIDGCGKTSHSKRLAEYLKAEWRRFPNRDTPFGKILGEHLNKKWASVLTVPNPTPTIEGVDVGDTVFLKDDGLDAMVFQAIQIANRVEFAQDFRAVLKRSHIVCDRYWPSGYAYGGADGLDKQYMIHVHEGLIQPNLIILFDVDVEEAFRRMGARDGGRERYEGNRNFLQLVANNYRELWDLKRDDPRFVKINSNGTPEETWAQLKKIVEERVHPFQIG